MRNVLILAGLYLLYKHFSRPKWIDDLLLRTYGPDHLDDGRKDPLAASIASEYGLPLTWVMELRNKGATDGTLGKYAEAVVHKILALGPPKNTNPDTLLAYKAQVLAATPQNA